MKNKIRAIGVGILVAVWLALTAFSWFGPRSATSTSERRPLAQAPEVSVSNIFSGKFMGDFEKFSLDQFPLRDSFRQIKALFHKYVMNYRDNNDIYQASGHFAKLDFPLDETSVSRAAYVFGNIYNNFLKESGSNIYFVTVPDKGYFLAEENGYPAMDYEAMFSLVKEKMPWATHIDIADLLSLEDYYYTDTHWKQEKLLPVAQAICQAMGTQTPKTEDFHPVTPQEPFYGVYHGQAALPVKPETITLMESELLDGCQVYNHETGKYVEVYDKSRLTSDDLYETYLSGAQSLLTIENPQGEKGKELIVFRDSFGSSIAPLLVQGYEKVTLVDVRYLQSAALDRYITFQGQDVLFLYSTLVLNDSATIR